MTNYHALTRHERKTPLLIEQKMENLSKFVSILNEIIVVKARIQCAFVYVAGSLHLDANQGPP